MNKNEAAVRIVAMICVTVAGVTFFKYLKNL